MINIKLIAAKVIAWFDKDLDALIKAFVKLEASLDTLVAKKVIELEATKASAEHFALKLITDNAALDRVYRISHRISEITK
ncbi:hypothetical protein D3Y57_05395 [Sphingomonas paeninsulae]|uniref:Uncharacterized protein n=1 Tax=Sphingomonas paeninsulae TaxID=2319844 RepID=A0A494TI64_SPHPE|nr:hypothetical protein [Sphingomonas paeninsulae]AYJ85516.1 hypothetical protein D3Y57_05395 [Sphingomonas paeninsulae]